jgi:hypothetical protein
MWRISCGNPPHPLFLAEVVQYLKLLEAVPSQTKFAHQPGFGTASLNNSIVPARFFSLN